MFSYFLNRLGYINVSEKLPLSQTYVRTGLWGHRAFFAFDKFFYYGKVINPQWYRLMKDGDCIRKQLIQRGDNPDAMPSIDSSSRNFVEKVAALLSFVPPV